MAENSNNKLISVEVLNQYSGIVKSYVDNNINNLQTEVNNKSDSTHNHDTVYQPLGSYVSEKDFTDLQAVVSNKSDSDHTHEGLYQPLGSYVTEDAFSALQNTVNNKSDITHNHNGIYQPIGSYATEEALNTLKTTVDNKSDSTHNHDTVYQPKGSYVTEEEFTILQNIVNGIRTAYGITLEGGTLSQEDSEKYNITQEDFDASIEAGALNAAFNNQADIVYCAAFITYDTNKLIMCSDLKIGDVVYIKNLEVPDRWYIGQTDDGYAFSKLEIAKFIIPELTKTDTETGNAVTDIEVNEHKLTIHRGTFLTEHQSLIEYVKRNEFGDLAFKDSLSAADVGALSDTTHIPTKTSDLTNDSGFMTTYTETDPTVPSWAKQTNKPTYTADEVGALPDTTVIPTKVSQLENDEGYIKATESFTPISSEEVDQKLKDIIGTAPEMLDTLQEIANAINNDANFASNMLTELNKKEDKSALKALAYKDSLSAADVGTLPSNEIENQYQKKIQQGTDGQVLSTNGTTFTWKTVPIVKINGNVGSEVNFTLSGTTLDITIT